MSEQLAFEFDERTESRFREFLELNPEFYEYFKRFAFEKIKRGGQMMGRPRIYQLFEHRKYTEEKRCK